MSVLDIIKNENKKPINIIHGTDWWTDCDDIVALRILCRAHKKGVIDLKCVCADAVCQHTAASIDAFLRSEGLCLPIGLDKSFKGDESSCKYQEFISQLPHKIKNEDCPDGFKLYRKMLWESEGKCHITEIGFPQIIHQLLISKADELCPLDGMELVKQKVEKIWMMAGDWRNKVHREYNVVDTVAGLEAMKFILNNSPVPITCLGFEVGHDVITGQHLREDDIMHKAFELSHYPNGRSSWDPMLVMLAIIGDAKKAGYKEIFGTAYVDEEGYTIMKEHKGGLHSYVVKLHHNSFYEDMINEII